MTNRPLRGIFVTGTDTGVGKTVVSAALLHWFRRTTRVRYWKPIQTGIEEDNDTATVQWLTGAAPGLVLDEGVRLPRPVSPHLAARLSGVSISLDDLVAIAAAQPAADSWIVEGAGGVLVPVNDHDLVVDLIARLGLPAVVVARSTLGTINHTLLTVEALRARALSVAGVVMVGEPNRENRIAIESYGQVPVIAELPFLTPLAPQALQAAVATLQTLGGISDCFEPVAAAPSPRHAGSSR